MTRIIDADFKINCTRVQLVMLTVCFSVFCSRSGILFDFSITVEPPMTATYFYWHSLLSIGTLLLKT